MKKEELNITYQLLSWDNLSLSDQKLVHQAVAAMSGAHAPYSNFRVGSVVALVDGSTVSGNNQENAAYPSGLCAERVALFAAKSTSKMAIDTLVVVANNKQGNSADAFSCGSCRQVMSEYAGTQKEPIRILMRNAQEQFVAVDDVRSLLPFSFGAANLK